MPSLQDQIEKLQGDRTKTIDVIISTMETIVGVAQGQLLEQVITEFVDKLDLDENKNIKNTLANRQRLAQLDNIFNSFTRDQGALVASVMVDSVDKIFAFNNKYFGALTDPTTLGKLFPDTTKAIEDWLGITRRGGLVENGYLMRIISDPTIRDNVRDSMFAAISSQKGYAKVKSDLKDYIAGIDDTGGALQKYYRNFVYDTFSRVDRIQAKLVADKLGLVHAIYEGGLIKTSRPFCIARNGKVFTSDEIAAFDPPTAKQPSYDPFADLGGYGCRHHLNYIPASLASILRPDLKKAA